MTALTASFSSVASRQSGGTGPSDRSAGAPSSMARTRASVGGTIGRPSHQPRSQNAARTASGSSSSSIRLSLIALLAHEARELLDGLKRPPRDGLGPFAAERVLDDEERQARDPEGGHFADREALERGGADEASGRTDLRDFEGVVETPRRARSSVAGPREHDVALLRQLGERLGRCWDRCVRLAPAHDGLHAVTLAKEHADRVGEQ